MLSSQAALPSTFRPLHLVVSSHGSATACEDWSPDQDIPADSGWVVGMLTEGGGERHTHRHLSLAGQDIPGDSAWLVGKLTEGGGCERDTHRRGWSQSGAKMATVYLT